MSQQTVKTPIIYKDKLKRCLSCGELLPPRRRKYCSQECPQDLRLRLNRRTGLLCALNTRYATFYFSEHTIVMDLLPFGTHQVFSFMLARTPKQKPPSSTMLISTGQRLSEATTAGTSPPRRVWVAVRSPDTLVLTQACRSRVRATRPCQNSRLAGSLPASSLVCAASLAAYSRAPSRPMSTG